MNDVKDTYKYHLKVGMRIVHRGICDDLGKREVEHRQTWPECQIHQVGRAVTHKAGLKWEREGGRWRYNSRPVGKAGVVGLCLGGVALLGLAGFVFVTLLGDTSGALVRVIGGTYLLVLSVALLGLIVWGGYALMSSIFSKREG